MSDPFRERRLPPEEARRVLRRALELSEQDPTLRTNESVTRDEIGRRAPSLGISAEAISRAFEDASEPEPPPSVRRDGSALLGASTRIELELRVDGEPRTADLEDVVEDIQETLGETGSTETVGKTVTWKLERPYKGQGRDLSVRLRSRNGSTRIVLRERFSALAMALFLGLGIGAGIGPMGAYVMAVVKHGTIGLLAPAVWIPLMFLLARTLFAAIVHRRERALVKLKRKLERRAREWPGARTKRRIEDARETTNDASAVEEAADVEAEEAEREGASRRRA